jgi:hypothetical protein
MWPEDEHVWVPGPELLLSNVKEAPTAGCRWLSPAILATQEAEIRRIVVQSQPGQIVRDSISKNPSLKRAGGVI